jgi:hypothetical protein
MEISLINKPTKLDTEPPFLKVYIEKLLALKDLPSEHHIILFEMLQIMCRKTNIVYLAQHTREIIAEKLGLKTHKYVIQKVNKMVEANILAKHTRGSYIVNTDFVSGLEWDDFFAIREKYYYLQTRFNTETGEVSYTSGYAEEIKKTFELREKQAKEESLKEARRKKRRSEKQLDRYYAKKKLVKSSNQKRQTTPCNNSKNKKLFFNLLSKSIELWYFSIIIKTIKRRNNNPNIIDLYNIKNDHWTT